MKLRRDIEVVERENHSEEGKSADEKRRWERLIRTIIDIIRYLTSVKTGLTNNEQIIRRMIVELQHWFLVIVH